MYYSIILLLHFFHLKVAFWKAKATFNQPKMMENDILKILYFPKCVITYESMIHELNLWLISSFLGTILWTMDQFWPHTALEPKVISSTKLTYGPWTMVDPIVSRKPLMTHLLTVKIYENITSGTGSSTYMVCFDWIFWFRIFYVNISILHIGI